ncbi:MAG: hypothetical protein NT157_02060, partial [Candidatus Micrarchaeota archaeon]|nr:hypothetical protein [Candidatus Micrarchaeota archaeon]
GDDLWNGNEKYLQELRRAISFCAADPPWLLKAPVSLKRTAQYSRYNEEYQKWYTPLVIAEALYLEKTYGIGAKLGPTSETAFDKLILDSMKEEIIVGSFTGIDSMGFKESDYQIFWYTRPLERQIAYTDYVFFSDSKDDAARKLKGKPELARWLAEIASPFYPGMKQNEGLDAVIALKEKVEEISKNPPKIPAAQGDWWFKWPPGSCG